LGGLSPLDLQLTFHLREKIKFFKHVLEYDFKGDWHVAALFNSFEYFSELATSNRLN